MSALRVGFAGFVELWFAEHYIIVRKQMAQVLAGKIAQGQYSFDEAVAVAREILFETRKHWMA